MWEMVIVMGIAGAMVLGVFITTIVLIHKSYSSTRSDVTRVWNTMCVERAEVQKDRAKHLETIVMQASWMAQLAKDISSQAAIEMQFRTELMQHMKQDLVTAVGHAMADAMGQKRGSDVLRGSASARVSATPTAPAPLAGQQLVPGR